MLVNVEMDIDSRILAFLPARWNTAGLPVLDAVVGKVTHINRNRDPKVITVDSKNENGDWFTVKVPDYRIKQFTFGGVWVANPEYNPKLIEDEDRKKLEAEVKD